jgi:hypothetical protein
MPMKRLLVLVCIVAAGGCTIRTGDMTLVSTKNIASLRAAEVRGNFEASDCRTFTPPNLKEAIDRAIEQGGGNAITDAALYFEQYPFLACYRAKGTVVRLKATKE